jgi:hypothetical protein
MKNRSKLKNIEEVNLMVEQSYLKSKGLLKEESINEKITDYFKSREEIASKFLEVLKQEPLKALNSVLPYFMDFIDVKLGSHRTDDETSMYGPDVRICKFLPNLCQIFKKDGKDVYPPNYIVDETKLNLVNKITEKEILNLVSTHENFSLKKLGKDLISPFVGLAGIPMFKKTGKPEELNSNQ